MSPRKHSLIESKGSLNMEASSMKKYAAEAFGTFVLTLFGCGSAAVAGATLGTLGIAMAFGLSIVAMAFVIGNVSGCHINPAVSFGLFLDKRLSGKDLVGYWVAQFVGGIVAAAVLALVISMCDLGGVAATGLGCDGYGAASAVGISLVGALIVEVILTCIFVLSVLGSTADERTAPYAGIIIGLTLAFVHIMGIPLTGTSVNPARSFGPARFRKCGYSLRPRLQAPRWPRSPGWGLKSASSEKVRYRKFRLVVCPGSSVRQGLRPCRPAGPPRRAEPLSCEAVPRPGLRSGSLDAARR